MDLINDDLDALIGSKLFGHHVKWFPENKIYNIVCEDSRLIPVPRYSQSLDAAWFIITKNIDKAPWIYKTDMLWACQFTWDNYSVSSTAKTAPLAICLAGLKLENITYE